MALGATVAKLLASLDLDTRGFDAGVRRADRGLGQMEGGLGRVSTRAVALGTAVGTGIERLAEGGIHFLFDQIRSGEEGLRVLQDVTAQTGAVIESTGGKAHVTAEQVRDLAEAQESLTTVDDKVVQSGENLLLTFTNIGGDIFPQATKAMVDMAVAMNGGNAEGIDLKNTAIQIGKALQDPIKGVTALRRVGVQLTAQQEEQIKEFIKLGDIEGAQKIILGELTTEFGKAGEAAGTSGAAGLRRLNDAVEDSQISLATGLAPALEDIRNDLAKSLGDPGTQQDIRNLGVFLGDAARSGYQFAKSVPWDKVADGLKTAAGFAGDLIKVFTNLPPEAQGTILALAGLNKISGGAVSGLIGQLGKGLIKGVLGMNAGVVNINAGVVNGAGGVPTPGKLPAAGASLIGAISLAPAISAALQTWLIDQINQPGGARETLGIQGPLTPSIGFGGLPNLIADFGTYVEVFGKGVDLLQNPPGDNQVANDLEDLRHAMLSANDDNITATESVRHALDAASSKNVAAQERVRAKAAATATSLENLRHSMLAKQSAANSLLHTIAAKKTVYNSRVNTYIRITNTGTRYRISANSTTAVASGGTAGYTSDPTRL